MMMTRRKSSDSLIMRGITSMRSLLYSIGMDSHAV